jgi:hypothetical protein
MVTDGLGEERWKEANKSLGQVVFMVGNSASRSTDYVRGLRSAAGRFSDIGPYLLVSKRVRSSQIKTQRRGNHQSPILSLNAFSAKPE